MRWIGTLTHARLACVRVSRELWLRCIGALRLQLEPESARSHSHQVICTFKFGARQMPRVSEPNTLDALRQAEERRSSMSGSCLTGDCFLRLLLDCVSCHLFLGFVSGKKESEMILCLFECKFSNSKTNHWRQKDREHQGIHPPPPNEITHLKARTREPRTREPNSFGNKFQLRPQHRTGRARPMRVCPAVRFRGPMTF